MTESGYAVMIFAIIENENLHQMIVNVTPTVACALQRKTDKNREWLYIRGTSLNAVQCVQEEICGILGYVADDLKFSKV